MLHLSLNWSVVRSIEGKIDGITVFCVNVSLIYVPFADFLPTAIVMATKEGSACLLQ
jgi:hypothetical protein